MEKLLGDKLCQRLYSFVDKSCLTEIRIRLGKEIVLKNIRGKVLTGIIADEKLLTNIMDIATNFSMYSYEDELKRGFVYYKDGIRIGVGGQASIRDEGMGAFKKISSLCIRIPHEIKGCSEKVKFLYENYNNTLIVAPPGCGKTTLIRDLTRVLARSHDVLVIDERYEFGGLSGKLDIGKMSDLIQGVPKHLCFEGAIKALSPEIIVCDEIFGQRDAEVVKKTVGAGVKILAGIHSDSFENVEKLGLRFECYFDNFIVLSSNPQVGSIKSIIRK